MKGVKSKKMRLDKMVVGGVHFNQAEIIEVGSVLIIAPATLFPPCKQLSPLPFIAFRLN